MAGPEIRQVPSWLSPNLLQSLDGTLRVGIIVRVWDFDRDDLKIRIQYSLTGPSSWQQATIDSVPSIQYGLKPDVDNGQTYQVGSSQGIQTSAIPSPINDQSSNTIVIFWDAAADESQIDGLAWILITVSDGALTTTYAFSGDVVVDVPAHISTVPASDDPDVVPITSGNQVTISSFWAASDPGITEVSYRVNESPVWYSAQGAPGQVFVKLTITGENFGGDDYVYIRSRHTNARGYTVVHEDGFKYYVTPLTVPAPVDQGGHTSTTLRISFRPHPNEIADGLYYAVRVTYGGNTKYINGSTSPFSLGNSPQWYDDSFFFSGNFTIGSLTTNTEYTFGVQARNPKNTSIVSNILNFLTLVPPSPSPATISYNSAAQSASAFEVPVSIEVDDPNDDNCQLKIQYSVNGSSGPWIAATIKAASVTADYGTTPDIDNDSEYQIGSVTPVLTNAGSNTITFTWDAEADLGDAGFDGTAYLSIIADDGTAPNIRTTQSLSLDNAPAQLTNVELENPLVSGITTVSVKLTWLESNPNTNEVAVKIGAGAYGSYVSGDTNTSEPDYIDVTVSTLYGDDYITIKGKHVDDFGNTVETEFAETFYVKPTAPEAPTLSSILTNSVDVEPNDDTTDAAGVTGTFEHAIQVWSQGAASWVQADGSLGSSEIWQTASAWGSITVTGLEPHTYYEFRSKVRNINDDDTESDLGTVVSTNTANNAPEIINLQVFPPDNGSSIYKIEGDLRDKDDNVVAFYLEFYDGSNYFNLSLLALGGDFQGLSGVESELSYRHFQITWDYELDTQYLSVYQDQVYSSAKFRISASDGHDLATFETPVFAFDNKAPVFTNVTLAFSNVNQNDVTVTWSAAVTEDNHATYELYFSTVGYEDAAQQHGIKWDAEEDIALATKATVTTVVTGLVTGTFYYVALMAVDINGNRSEPVFYVVTTRGNYEITGYAIDENKAVVSGATCAAHRTADGAHVSTALSDGSGYFSVPVPDDTTEHMIIINKTGYEPFVLDDKLGTRVIT